ncbi:MAG: cupin domain-containing protein [Candidatus Phaeomarinobacter sp.]
MKTVNLAQKHTLFDEAWSPKIVGDLNGSQVKLAKFHGAFTWHAHENEDELFLMTKGTLRMKLRDGDQIVGEGEFIIVPRGVEHCPVAESDEVHVMMVEPASTVNTGNADDSRTVTDLERI